MEPVDSASRIVEIRRTIEGKLALKLFYREAYKKHTDSLKLCPKEGLALELGSGAGFAKKVIPQLITSDIIPYDGIDLVIDATKLPFENSNLRFIAMMNTFHHIPDVAAFFAEANRCLVRGGRLFLLDQHPGYISTPILRFIHHEAFSPAAKDWNIDSSGRLSGANGALAWTFFARVLERFKELFPSLKIVRYTSHTPLRYWLAGGLKSWSLLPGWAFGVATQIDRRLSGLSLKFGSFVDIEIVRQ